MQPTALNPYALNGTSSGRFLRFWTGGAGFGACCLGPTVWGLGSMLGVCGLALNYYLGLTVWGLGSGFGVWVQGLGFWMYCLGLCL